MESPSTQQEVTFIHILLGMKMMVDTVYLTYINIVHITITIHPPCIQSNRCSYCYIILYLFGLLVYDIII